MYPLLLKPPVKDYVWGGSRLKTEYGLETENDIAAEGWMLSCHKDGSCVIINGELAGKTLPEVLDIWGKDALGENAAKFAYFPLLIKLIDAKQKLSVQVHPNDEYALKNEGEYGKTEMWYIVDCEDDAYLYYGVNRDITKSEFEKRIKNNTLLEILNKVPVKKGDVFFIPSGTIHAICSGILICEVQQNSNTTYRVYDYDRRGADGKPRELHIEKAIDVSLLTPSPKQAMTNSNILASCKYFTVEKLNGNSDIALDKATFRSVTVTDGNATLQLGGVTTPLTKGETVFIPAQDRTATITGDFEAIMAYV